MDYHEIILLRKEDYEEVRKNPFNYRKPTISDNELEQLRQHISSEYECKATITFAYKIYMVA